MQSDLDGHCCRHCPKAKRRKTSITTTNPDDTLPDLPDMELNSPAEPVTMADNTTYKQKMSSETGIRNRSGVTDKVASATTETEETTTSNTTMNEENLLSHSAVTLPVRNIVKNTDNMINIEAEINTEPETEMSKDDIIANQEPSTSEPDRDPTMRLVVTQLPNTEIPGDTSTKQASTQQHVLDNYDVPEEIASEALLLLQTMNQPNPQEQEYADDYTLPVDTAKLPDLISEMNQERGIEMIVNYDAEIPEEMRLQMQTQEPTTNKDKEHDKDEDSDETIVFDAGELENPNIQPDIPSEKQIEDSEKSPKGQLMTQKFGIIKRKPASKRTYMCIGCGAKRKSKQEINQHHQEKHSSIKCPDCDRVFSTPDSLQRHQYTHAARDKFVCEKCGKDYPFKSDLNRHKIKH